MSTTDQRRVDLEPGEIGIDLVSDEDGSPTLLLSGEIDAATVGRLEACFLAVASAGATTVTVDFGDVGFVDSSGINALLVLRRTLGPTGRVQLRGCSPTMRRICGITGIGEVEGITVC